MSASTKIICSASTKECKVSSNLPFRLFSCQSYNKNPCRECTNLVKKEDTKQDFKPPDFAVEENCIKPNSPKSELNKQESKLFTAKLSGISSVISSNFTSDINITTSTSMVSQADNVNEQSLVILVNDFQINSTKSLETDREEEMERTIVNINRKSRPLIKHVNVGNNNVLHIDVHEKELKKKQIRKNVLPPNEFVSNWEDLCNEDDDFNEADIEQVILHI